MLESIGDRGSRWEAVMEAWSKLRFWHIALVLVPALMSVPLVAQSRPGGASQPTFTKDVVPILQRSCQDCHRPGSVAPMSLLSYEDVRPWARSIKARVLYMPSETDLYFPMTDARYEQALIPRVTFAPIPSLWGHTAGAASNPADLRFLNGRIAAFLSLK
jgi:hypothetical protein